jgi:hypothetical protein
LWATRTFDGLSPWQRENQVKEGWTVIRPEHNVGLAKNSVERVRR